MAATDELPMLQDFPRWIASTGIGDDETRRKARWTAISALAHDTSRGLTEALLRLALKSRHAPASTTLQTIRQAFYDADNTFQMQGNDKELETLAAATLAAMMSMTGEDAADVALAVSTTMVGGHRKSKLPMDLNVLADAAIDRIADANRKRPSLSGLVNSESPKFDFEKAVAKAKENSWDGVANAFPLAADAVRGAMAALARRQVQAVTALDKFLRIQDEELQMLWWLTGGESLDLQVRFDAVAAEVQPLVFGKELADATEFLPGPRSMRALLSRAGVKDRKKLPIADVIQASDPTWLNSFMRESEPSPVTAPLHFAIARQLETGPGATWVAGWAAAVELAKDLALSPQALAISFYRERLLILFESA